MPKPLKFQFKDGFGESRAIFITRFEDLPHNSIVYAPTGGFAIVLTRGGSPLPPILSGQKANINPKKGLFKSVGRDEESFSVLNCSGGAFTVKAATNFPYAAVDIDVRRVKYFLRAQGSFRFDPTCASELVAKVSSFLSGDDTSIPVSHFRGIVEKTLADVMTEVGAKALSKKGLSGAYENVASINAEVLAKANRTLEGYGLNLYEISVRVEEEDEVTGKVRDFDLSKFG